MSGTREKINFNNPDQNYYGNYYFGYGYGGMNWVDVFAFTKVQIEKAEQELGWCDTGYQNALHGKGAAFMPGFDYIQSYGGTETFNLKSAFLAAAWEGQQNLEINTYKSGVLVGSDVITVHQTGGTYRFSGAMFRHITGVAFVYDGGATGGSTCTYGSPTYAPQMAMDNLKVVFNGGIPGAHSAPKNHHPHIAAALAGAGHMNVHGDVGAHDSNTGPPHHAGSAYHGELLSLPDHDPDGLTNQFHLPAVEHFG
ncbi:MAG TPA: hypothetical protein VGI20_09650 [Rhizomicrobium sp.]